MNYFSAKVGCGDGLNGEKPLNTGGSWGLETTQKKLKKLLWW
jgi:hypothetical protein